MTFRATIIIYITIALSCQHKNVQHHTVPSITLTAANYNEPGRSENDTIEWIRLTTDSGIVHAAIARPKGTGPFPAIIILHGTHGFAEEYIQLASRFSENGFVGIAACWFAGRKGKGERFITPIEFKNAPPLIDVAGADRFRISRHTIHTLVKSVITLPYVKQNQLGLFGHSRGAGAALDYLLTHPGMIQGIILNSAGYPPEIIKRATEVEAPVLLLHGLDDNPEDGGSTFTNVEMARQFETALKAANKSVDTKYYEGGGHNSLFTNAMQFDNTVFLTSEFLKRKFAK